MTLTNAERRAASAFLLAVWNHYRKLFRRRLHAFELIVIAYALASAIVGCFDDRDGPRVSTQLAAIGGYWDDRPSKRSKGLLELATSDGMKGDLFEQASATLRYLDIAGDDPRAKSKDSVSNDRLAITALSKHWLATAIKYTLDKRGSAELEAQGINDSAAHRWIADNVEGAHLSHSQIRERRLRRSERILDSLHHDFPEKWSAKRRPIDDAPSGDGANDNKQRLSLPVAA
jgi:hypothetical protein